MMAMPQDDKKRGGKAKMDKASKKTKEHTPVLGVRKARDMTASPLPPKKKTTEDAVGHGGPWDDQGLGMPRQVLDAVVKIFATHCDPNHSLPWQMRRQTYSTSSGFVISERRILTNAHSVENYTVVKVKKRGCDHKYIAKVLAIGNECDIALLTVEDDSFWEGLTELKPAERLPHLQEAVTVVGFPIGGENISVTAGVVSRVEMQQYCHSSQELLGVQIDAAINSGNSGGPALNANFELVGIAFQSLNASDAENIGYIIPWLVVDHFLEDYRRNKKYTGFCSSGFEWQRTENKFLRKAMGLKDDRSGILVKWVDPTSNAFGKLEKGDIVTHFDDVPIANDGTVPYRAGERISFHYLKSLKFVGDNCKLRVWRNDSELELEFPLGAAAVPLLVPIHEERRMPEYLVVAGLVFVALSERYLRSEYGDQFDREAPVKLLEKFMHGRKKTATEQVVVLSQVLDSDVNTGYEYLVNTQVVKFNGTPVENIAKLAKLLDECKDRFLRFDLDYDEVIILDREAAVASNKDILSQHGIPSDRSIGGKGSNAPEPKQAEAAPSAEGPEKRSAPADEDQEQGQDQAAKHKHKKAKSHKGGEAGDAKEHKRKDGKKKAAKAQA